MQETTRNRELNELIVRRTQLSERLRCAMERVAIINADREPQRLRKVKEQKLLEFGGPITNRPPASSQVIEKPRAKWLGGEDRLEAVLYVKWHQWGNFQRRLEVAQEAAQTKPSDDQDDLARNLVGEWAVMPQGARMGDGTGPHLKYVLKYDDCQICIMNVDEYQGDLPNVKIVIGSAGLMESGLRAKWEEILSAIEGDFGGEIEKNIVSRIDPCLDLPNVPTSQFVEKFLACEFVSRGRTGEVRGEEDEAPGVRAKKPKRAQKPGQFSIRLGGRKLSSFALGKGIRLQVYDKLLEVRTKCDARKEAIIRAQRWGGEYVESATRVEFQVRGEYLRKRGVYSVEDWLQRAEAVVEYLAGVWFRFTERYVDRANKHQSRAKEWSVWSEIRQAFRACYEKSPEPVTRTQAATVDALFLRHQGFGVLGSLVSYTGELPDRDEDVVALAKSLIRTELKVYFETVDPKTLARKLRAKQLRQRTRVILRK